MKKTNQIVAITLLVGIFMFLISCTKESEYPESLEKEKSESFADKVFPGDFEKLFAQYEDWYFANNEGDKNFTDPLQGGAMKIITRVRCQHKLTSFLIGIAMRPGHFYLKTGNLYFLSEAKKMER